MWHDVAVRAKKCHWIPINPGEEGAMILHTVRFWAAMAGRRAGELESTSSIFGDSSKAHTATAYNLGAKLTCCPSQSGKGYANMDGEHH